MPFKKPDIRANPQPIDHVIVQRGLILSVLLSAFEIGYGLLRYTAPMNIPLQYLGYGVMGLGLIGLVSGMGIWCARSSITKARSVLQRGVFLGLVVAVIWATNILFTHLFLANAEKPTVGTLLVDVSFLVIFLVTFGTSGYSAYQTRQVKTGVGIGLWSGLVAGVLTSMLVLMMLYIWMGFLVQRMNTGEIQAFLQSGTHDQTAWFFWEEFSGTMGYLITDLLIGGAVGLVGGLTGKGLALLRK